MPNLLRVEANERVDLGDFQHAIDGQVDAVARVTSEQILTNPAGTQRTWILEGFRMLAIGTQVQVTRGVALLARREGGQTYYGVVTAEGDLNKIVDITTFAPGTYGIFIRFEYVDGDAANRVFWNPSGLGSEFARNIPTRRLANWSVRIELTTPGGEWAQIGTVNRTPMTIVDQRPLYFEGKVNASYQSGWSTDGGGVANDRNADRQQFGVRDFQTFTAAMRQCLEDVKGRGLRRWWDPDIGGMNIGFNAAPVEDRLAVFDANFNLLGSATVPQVTFDTGNDRLRYTRATNQWDWDVAGTSEMQLNASGLQITDGLVVGFSGTPGADEVQVGDANFKLDFVSTVDVRFQGDSTDYLQYDRAANFWNFIVANVIEAQITAAGLRVTDGFVVGHTGVPVNDTLTVGDTVFGLIYGSNPDLLFDTSDRFTYIRASNRFDWAIGGTVEAGLNAIGFNIGSETPTQPFTIGTSATGSLGGTATNALNIFEFDHLNANVSRLQGYAYRNVNGADWVTESTYIHKVIDSTYMGYVRFSGASVHAGVAEHVGIGVGGVGAANPTLIVDAATTYVPYYTATDTAFTGDSSARYGVRNNIRACGEFSSSGALTAGSAYNLSFNNSPATGVYDFDASGLVYLGSSILLGMAQTSSTNAQRMMYGIQVNLGGFVTRLRLICWSTLTAANANTAGSLVWVGRSQI